MYQVLVFIEYFTIIGLFVECWVAIRKWNSMLHGYLFFYCVSNLVYNAGNLLEIQAQNKEGYVVALKMGYLGRIWIGLSLFLFTMELCRVHLPALIKATLAVVHAFIYALIIDIENNTLYYTSMDYVIQSGIPRLLHTGGIFYHIQTALMLGYALVGITVVALQFFRERHPVAKKRLLMMLLTLSCIVISYIMYVFKLVPFANLFDLTILGFALGTVFMLVAIFRYRMLDAEEIARNYVVDELSEGIIVANSEGNVTYFNKPARLLFPELNKNDVLGKNAAGVLERLRYAIYCEEPIRMDERIFTPKANSLLLNNGTSVGTLYSLSDDTEHFNYLNQLREQKQIADDANKAKSQFLANMSHEIRTPINAILGLDEMVLRESGEKEILEYAEDIQTAGKTLLALVNDILDFSKVEEGKMEIIPVQYEPIVMKNDLVMMTKDRAARKDLTFETEYDDDIPRLLRGDEIRVRQCAINLLTNAVKYTEKGSVTLKIGYTKKDDDHITLDFSVSDTGSGIKPEDMGDLFSPFKRIDEKKNRSIEGSGLGISITKRLLELMGSDLNVSSEVGKGSVFSFSVVQEVLSWDSSGERPKNVSDKNEKKAYKEMFHAPDARLLVVDDIKMNLTVITKLLRKTEMTVDTALSGRKAIEMAEQNEYDIIFVDHLMPEMDGIETLKHLKEGKTKGSPVYIALTANAISGAREMYLDEGFRDYVSKPVEGEKLEKLIMSYLPPEKLLDTP